MSKTLDYLLLSPALQASHSKAVIPLAAWRPSVQHSAVSQLNSGSLSVYSWWGSMTVAHECLCSLWCGVSEDHNYISDLPPAHFCLFLCPAAAAALTMLNPPRPQPYTFILTFA